MNSDPPGDAAPVTTGEAVSILDPMKKKDQSANVAPTKIGGPAQIAIDDRS